jgi:hypothetical protein
VMLTWIAPTLADLLYPGRLDAALVAAFAAVHDAVELWARVRRASWRWVG